MKLSLEPATADDTVALAALHTDEADAGVSVVVDVVDRLVELLFGLVADVRGADLEAPNNVGVAGQSGIAIGAISADRNSGNAFWIWAAVATLRLAAESAAMIAREAL